MKNEKQYQYVLAVIGMQHGFTASRSERLKRDILKEIDQAKANKVPIVLLEMGERDLISMDGERSIEDSGAIYPWLIESLKDYDSSLWSIKHKIIANAAVAVLSACQEFGWNTDCFRHTGVGTDECVLATGFGIHELVPQARIQFVKSACNMEDIPPLGQWWWFKGTAQDIYGFAESEYELV